ISGSSTLCNASARGSRLNVWNTNPISLLRIRASSSSLKSLTFCPLSQYSPLVGVSRQPIRFMSVDLPDPDGPMHATNSFFLIWMSTPRSACTTSTPDTVILTHHLTREYQMGAEVVHALRGVDIQIKKNEFVACMGPSGSGKS